MKRMRAAGRQKIIASLAASFILAAFAFANLLAQNADPQPSPSAVPSPTETVSPTPARSPSPTPLPGAQNFHQWGSITVFNGLPSDSVRAVSQTPDGVMWFGTENGLARFDGRRIQKITLGSAESDRITALETAPGGELWIGTRRGAFIYSAGRVTPIEGTQDIGITAILVHTDIYLATDAGYVFRIAAGTGVGSTPIKMFTEPIKADEGGVLAITGLVERDGRLLASTAGRGVFSIENNAAAQFATVPRPIFVNAMANVDGKLWLGSDAGRGVSGLYLVDGGPRAQRVPAPTSIVLSLASNDAGLWAGTERYGLFHIHNGKLKKTYTFENTSGGLRSDTVYTLFTDREGVIWIGTNRGVSRFDRLGPSQQIVSDIPNSNFIRVLYRTANGIVYAGSNRGLFVQRGDKWMPVPAHGNRPIYALSEDASGRLLVGGIERLAQNADKFAPETDVRSFADFQGVKYAAVNGAGLAKVGAAGYSVVNADPSVTALLAADGKLWLGTMGNGLFSYDGRNVVQEFTPEVLKSGAVRRIFGASDGTLWVAGEYGVFRISGGQVEKVIDAEDVRDVYANGEDVWAATTERGLLHARRDADFGWLVASIGFEQGLPSEKAFSILPGDEGLLIATNRGVVSYKPGSIAPKLIATRVLSQRVHDLAELRSSIELEYPQNSLLVEVAGQSSRTYPEEFQYAFALRNERGDVLEKRLSSEPQYAPGDLKPGTYTIEATAFDRDLLASEPMSVQFSVAKAPFPWTATALGILLAIAVVALIWAIIERTRIVRQSRELAAARLDLAHEAERERSRIARDLHDQTLADLRDLMLKSDKTLPPGLGFRDDIESISTEIRRICEDLSPSVLENVGFVAALEFLLSHTVANYRFDARGTADEEIRFPVNVQLQIYRIAQEVLTNIKRHAEAALVEMNVDVPAAGGFELTIVNDGKPFTPPEPSNPGGRGIAGIRSRASLINAAVEWDQTREGHPRFRLSL